MPYKYSPSCPECDSANAEWWPKVCRGGGEEFVDVEGIKLFWWTIRAPEKFTCDLNNPPKHFHYQCKVCGTRWTVFAKSEMPRL